MKCHANYEDLGGCVVREPQAAYDYGYAPAAPKLQVHTYYRADDHGDIDSAYDCDDEEPMTAEEWDLVLSDPELQAEAIRRVEKVDAEIAAGTWKGLSTEEVFAELYREFPEVFGGQNG